MKKDFLKKYKIRPSKRLGQNFLIDKKALQKIIEAANCSKNDTILEIGPGLGFLTLELAKRVKKVIAIEKDKRMCEIVKNVINVRDIRNVEIIQGDILKIQNTKYKTLNTKYKVVANIPYYLTSPLIRKFLESKNPSQAMVLMVQKEVAQRICAQPPKMSLLSIAVQFYAETKIIDYISKKAFWPQPKVDSAIIKIIPRSSASCSARFRNKFFKIVKAGFSHPRKQLINNLSQGLNLERERIKKILLGAKINPQQRAETLSVDNWRKLVRLFEENIV